MVIYSLDNERGNNKEGNRRKHLNKIGNWKWWSLLLSFNSNKRLFSREIVDELFCMLLWMEIQKNIRNWAIGRDWMSLSIWDDKKRSSTIITNEMEKSTQYLEWKDIVYAWTFVLHINFIIRMLLFIHNSHIWCQTILPVVWLWTRKLRKN